MKVLCVDDEPDLLYLFTFILTRAGHEVIQATNGEEALARLEDGLPDVIVTDLMMPVMDGAEFVARLRADPRWSAIPVVLVTATTDPQVAADAIVPKMHGPSKVLQKVEELGNRGVA